jgi:hypothetical protein
VNKNFAEEYITMAGRRRWNFCVSLHIHPKTLVLERADDDRLRLMITLKKLGQETILEYFLDEQDRAQLALALGN